MSNMKRKDDMPTVQTRIRRTKAPRPDRVEYALKNPDIVEAELCRRSLYHFLKVMWPEVSGDKLRANWHLKYLSRELEILAERVSKEQPSPYDLLVNIPPGTTKSTLISIMFPTWCWIRWPWMRFISTSYAAALSLEHSDKARELVRSDTFKRLFPNLDVRVDKDTKSNFALTYEEYDPRQKRVVTKKGGNRYSTSFGGTITGFHGHILIVDDPLNPVQAASDVELNKANTWIDETLSSRRINKACSPIIYIMQRLHQNDVSGYLLEKYEKDPEMSPLKHICLPGDILEYGENLKPPYLKKYYLGGLLDPVRMNEKVLAKMKAALGQYGYAAQFGQAPTPPGGGMFQTQNLQIMDDIPNGTSRVKTIRFWDKAATETDRSAYTCGVKMSKLSNGIYVVEDVRRGRWASHKRESFIRATAEADGYDVIIWHEREPGSGGLDSARGTTLNLTGFMVHTEGATGDKVVRADPFSVQLNMGNVILLRGEWNKEYIAELSLFPYSKYKDQVDASSGAFNKLLGKRKEAGAIG